MGIKRRSGGGCKFYTADNTLRVAFYKMNGNLVDYPENRYDEEYEWIENHEFEAILTIDTYHRGRSSVKFILKDDSGTCYEMFVTDMLNLVKTAKIENGKVHGKWTFCKRGANYGIKMVIENEKVKQSKNSGTRGSN